MSLTSDDPCAPGLLARLPPPRKVAIVRASRIGDYVCATPAFRALRRALPGAEITLIALPFARELVARSALIDRHESFPGFPGIAEQWFEARRATAFFQRMQAECFDLAIQLHGSGIYANPFTLLLGARATAGWVRAGDGPGRLDAALPQPAGLHEIERVLNLTTFLGALPCGEETEFPLFDADHVAAERLLARAARPLIGLHPAATDPTKRWPPQRFAEAGSAVQRRYGGTVVVVSGPGERPLADAVASGLYGPCLNLGGRTTLPVLGGVIARLALLISNDSGPAHIAYALGTPAVTIFGGTDPAVWGPLRSRRQRVLSHPVPCWPCNAAECSAGFECLLATDVDQVVVAAQAALEEEDAKADRPLQAPVDTQRRDQQ